MTINPTYSTISQTPDYGGECMRGSIGCRKDSKIPWYYVVWYWNGKKYAISRWKGERMYHERTAQKVLSLMQSDVENNVFRIEKYIGNKWSDVVPYIDEWLEAVRPTMKKGSHDTYLSHVKNHIKPFFQKNPFQLHEVQYDVLVKLLNSLDIKPNTKKAVMTCFQACLKYAHKSNRIPAMPPFPERRLYQIQEKNIEWLPSDRQDRVIDNIPDIHKPIFLWLKYHLRRPAEAMALLEEDYSHEYDVFIVSRSISGGEESSTTKTKRAHIVPCHYLFSDVMKGMDLSFGRHFFINPFARNAEKRYTHKAMRRIWNEACKKAGEKITMYAGLKHSGCSQRFNEFGQSKEQIQSVTGHADVRTLDKYVSASIAKRREAVDGKVIPFNRDAAAVG